jgi:hypothetical protein
MFRMNGMQRWHGCQGAYMFRMNGMQRCQGRDRDVTYQNNAWSNCRMAKSVYVQDERSEFLLQANPKYLHPCK